MFDYSVNDFTIEKFFSYTSTIPMRDVIAELDPNWVERYPNIRDKFDLFYNELGEVASKLWKEKTGKNSYYIFHDNKTVYQIKHKFSGKVYFVGRYDFRRAVGTSCYLYDGYIYDFEKMKKTDYISDVRALENSLWKKFEL